MHITVFKTSHIHSYVLNGAGFYEPRMRVLVSVARLILLNRYSWRVSYMLLRVYTGERVNNSFRNVGSIEFGSICLSRCFRASYKAKTTKK